jgi:hypothetical protein
MSTLKPEAHSTNCARGPKSPRRAASGTVAEPSSRSGRSSGTPNNLFRASVFGVLGSPDYTATTAVIIEDKRCRIFAVLLFNTTVDRWNHSAVRDDMQLPVIRLPLMDYLSTGKRAFQLNVVSLRDCCLKKEEYGSALEAARICCRR